MTDPDNPALNEDGTYKDASEMTWLHSPSEENRTISLADVQKKRKRSDSSANEATDTESPASVLTGLKSRSPAIQVAGKRMKKLSSKGKAAKQELSSQARKFFEARFIVGTESQDASSAQDVTQNDDSAPFKGYGVNWIVSSLGSSAKTSPTIDPQKEFSDYVNSAREVTEDPVRWWGYHMRQYPTLSAMARDYLAIQGSSVASERAFSSSGITDTLHRNRMETQVFGKAQVLKHAYKSHFLDAASEAKAHKVHDYIEVDI